MPYIGSEAYKLSRKKATKKYYLLNKDYYLNYQKMWRKNNPDRVKQQRKRVYIKQCAGIGNRLQWERNYRDTHRDELHEKNKNWAMKNRIKIKAYSVKRRKFLKSLRPSTVQRVYENNIKKYGTLTCYLCLNPIPFGKDSLEHKIPLSRGGRNNYRNLDISCLPCNCRKHTKTVSEYRRDFQFASRTTTSQKRM